MPLLLSLLAAKGLGALVGSLLLAARPVPGFTPPTVSPYRDSVRFETVLTRGFNRQLDQILESGSLVAVGYTVTLALREPVAGSLSESRVEFFHSTMYDPLTRTWSVFRSELAGTPDTLVPGLNLRQAKELLCRVSLALAQTDPLPRTYEHSCRIKAALNTIKLEAVDDRELDLNVFWNYHYPRATTAWARVNRP